MGKKLPIGISNYKKLIHDNVLYFDKSLFIKDVFDHESKILIFPRPRRMGKSVNISMLKMFLEIQREDIVADHEKFEKTKIWKQGEKYTSKFATHPVIFFSFKNLKRLNMRATMSKFQKTIKDEYNRHGYLVASDKLNNAQKEYVKSIINLSAEPDEYYRAVKRLCEFLFLHHNNKVYILIDDYDKPLYVKYPSEFFDNMSGLISRLFEETLNDNEWLEKAVITGMVHVGEDEIFSKIQDTEVLSLLNDESSTHFGFTSKEVSKLTDSQNLDKERDVIDEWYKYLSFKKHDIYNPWSVLQYIEQADLGPEPKWVNSSINVFVKEQLIKSTPSFKHELFDLLNKGRIYKKLYDKVRFSQFVEENDMLWSFIYHSGYLCTTEKCRILDNDYYRLSIPNKELNQIVSGILYKWLNECVGSTQLKAIYKALLDNDIETFKTSLFDFIQSVFTYFNEDKLENTIWAFLLGLVLEVQGEYKLEIEETTDENTVELHVLSMDNEKVAEIDVSWPAVEVDELENKFAEIVEARKKKLDDSSYKSIVICVGANHLHVQQV